MAGGVISTAQIFGLTIRESANDGSDFTNPGADYRRLFLGEDGLVHLKDSAGAVSSLGGTGTVVKVGTPKLRTAGNHTCNSTTWAELAAATGGPGTGTYDFDFTGCVAGDVAEFSMSVGWGSEATNGCLSVATVVSGSPVNYFMGNNAGAGDGIVGLYGFSGTFQGAAATAFYVIQSGDLTAGALKLRPMYRTTSATNKTLYGSTGDPAMFMAKVYRP